MPFDPPPFLDFGRNSNEAKDLSRARVRAAISIYENDAHLVQNELVSRVIENGMREVEGVLRGKYEVNLGHGVQFLIRARPLFGLANRIIATSLDTVSTFWTNPDNLVEALEYLNHQGAVNAEVSRLFVFSSADSAHAHCLWLDAHEKKYHNVFLCSLEAYREMLRDITPNTTAISNILQSDYALLEYDDPAPARGESIRVFASLDDRRLRFRLPDYYPSENTGVDLRQLKWLFRLLHDIPAGEIQEFPGASPGHRIAMRWQNGIWQDRNRWSARLKRMFDQRTADVTHLVFLQPREHTEELRMAFARIKVELEARRDNGKRSIKEELGITHIWFGQKWPFERSPMDGRLRGYINIGAREKFPFVLMMKFRTANDLMRYYEDPEHSRLRETLYKILCPATEKIYESAHTYSTPEQRGAIYDVIEGAATHFIERRDYRDAESIREIVESPPFDLRV